MAEQPEWALPHAPKSHTLIPECWLWLQRATQIWCLLQKNQTKKLWKKHEAQVHLLASLLCMRGMTQCMGWSVSGGEGTSYTVLRYVIYQTTVNTVTSRAKTGGSRHQTDARTQLKENTLEKPEKEAGKITHRPPQKTHTKKNNPVRSNWKYNIYSTTIERWWVLGCALSRHTQVWPFYLWLIGFNRSRKKQKPKNEIVIATCSSHINQKQVLLVY